MLTSSKDLAIEEAIASGAQYVLSQDPDADRFTAAQKLCVATQILLPYISQFSYSADGSWKLFSGDQIGAVLAAWTLECYRRRGDPLGTSNQR